MNLMPGHAARAARFVVSLIAAGSMTSVAHSARAQSSPRLAFAVASVKINKSGAGLVRLSTLPGRFSAVNVTLRMLLRNAYNIPDSRMSGGPPWIGVDRFDVEARSDGAEPAAQVRAMLRSLLEDRFKLNARIETRDLPVYALIVAKGDGKLGSQLRPSGDACLPPTPPAGAPPPPPPPGGLGPTSGQCPSILAPGAISGRQLTMGRLVETLSLWVDRTVIDRTGLEGNFDVDLQWLADRPLSGGRGDFERGGPPPPSSDLPSLFTAIREQLGLKLASQRGAVEMLLIDRAEKPTED
jgi:uncharacterized protein (TIGR03435 family)